MRRQLEPVVPAVLFLLILAAIGPWWSVYEFSADEGLNLMKAALFAEGHSLYDEIWSDQPPVLTVILSLVHTAFDGSVAAGRVTILATAGLLIWSLFRIVRRTEGRAAAWFAVIVLGSSSLFQELSVSIRIGLPAIAFAVTALDQALVAGARNQRWRFWVAGALFAVAVQTKFFVLVMAPALLLTTLCATDAEGKSVSNRNRVALCLEILVPACVVFLGLSWMTGADSAAQLVAPHVAAREARAFADSGGLGYLWNEVWKGGWAVAVLGVVGGLVARPWASRSRAAPLMWALTAAVVLAGHRPLWSHQVLLVVVPLAWMSGFLVAATGQARASESLWVRQTARLIVGGLAVAVAISAVQSSKLTAKGFHRGSSKRERAASRSVALFAPISRWIFTDRPMDAYRAKLLVPPPMAVFSKKRLVTGNLATEHLIEVVETYKPEQISLRRFRPREGFLTYLESDYVPIAATRRRRHYVDRRIETPVALLSATDDLLGRTSNGGFAGYYDIGTGNRFGGQSFDRPLSDQEILVRPPGSTQEVGGCFLGSYEVSGLAIFRRAAIAAARALHCAQGRLGGWFEEAALIPACLENDTGEARRGDREATLDNGTVPSALSFLMNLRGALRSEGSSVPSWLDLTIDRGLGFLLAAQGPEGGWPQRYPDRSQYHGYYTLNDGVTPEVIGILLRAHSGTDDPRYVDAARRGGEFLIRVQGAPPQSAWAQQYDLALRPAKARAFEPPGYSSLGERLRHERASRSLFGDRRDAVSCAARPGTSLAGTVTNRKLSTGLVSTLSGRTVPPMQIDPAASTQASSHCPRTRGLDIAGREGSTSSLRSGRPCGAWTHSRRRASRGFRSSIPTRQGAISSLGRRRRGPGHPRRDWPTSSPRRCARGAGPTGTS